MQIVISLCKEPDTISDPNGHFAIYDTDKRKVLSFIEIKQFPELNNSTRGTGMCYHGNYFYGICLAKEHRVASKLVVIDIKNGTRTVNDLVLSKAVHSIHPYTMCGPYTMLLANSTQNDLITIITLDKTHVVTEDVFFDFLTPEERLKYDWACEYKHDDSFHVNCVTKFNGYTFVSMFLDYKLNGSKKIADKHWRRTETKSNLGIIYNLTAGTVMHNNCQQPHSLIWDAHGDLLFCESGTFSLINVHKHIGAKLNGFTRGLVEDKQKGGYWVGLSYHRKFSTTVQGAMIQFVSYDMGLEDPIDLSHLGKEIYDIIPYQQGRYHG